MERRPPVERERFKVAAAANGDRRMNRGSALSRAPRHDEVGANEIQPLEVGNETLRGLQATTRAISPQRVGAVASPLRSLFRLLSWRERPDACRSRGSKNPRGRN